MKVVLESNSRTDFECLRCDELDPSRTMRASAKGPTHSGISDLAAYLATDGAKTLEQEELDPIHPLHN